MGFSMIELQNFDAKLFLKEYWQKKPVLIRNAVQGMAEILSPDDLAGLACEEGVETRLIKYQRDTRKWHVASGPFEEEELMALPRQDWSLLVQAVDQYVPEVSELLNCFRFVPDWRLDDIMVSFSPEGGSVGPHYDQYDVFLIQGQGKRKWSIGQKCSADTSLLEDQQLAILSEFDEIDSWVLEAGDMLYVPPQIAHWGTSVGNDGGMTFSVGFRAPSYERIVSGISDEVLQHFTEHDRYEDADLKLQENPAEIPREAVRKLGKIFEQISKNEELLLKWLGEEMTERKYTDLDYSAEDVLSVSDIEQMLQAGGRLIKSEQTRMAYAHQGKREIVFFLDAQSAVFAKEEAEILIDFAKTHIVTLKAFQALPDFFAELYKNGYIRFDEA